MINTWFISDTHFGHAKVLEYEKDARPFQSLEEMHEVMIERWNSVVRAQDIVYHLGDFAFGVHNICIASRLNGKKRLVMGNHDSYSVSEYLPYFEKLYGITSWKNCILSHVPIHPDQFGNRLKLNVHGHLHSKHVKCTEYIGVLPGTQEDVYREIKDKQYFNVSCEQNNLTPIHADIILSIIKD